MLAWTLLSAVSFLYPLWYEVLDIRDTIEEHAPLNHHRDGVERTDRAEHDRLFGEILASVNRDGQGLGDIRYRDPEGEVIDRLLTPAEIAHLEDVAGLVSALQYAGVAAAVAVLLLLIGGRYGVVSLPSGRRVAMSGLGTGLLAGLVVAVLGPVRVFYAAHDWVFPADKQWFFFYEDSLMTTLMQAPNLFLPAALSWLALTALLTTGLWLAGRRWIR